LSVRVQIALGAVFVASAIPKLMDPPGFAHMIYNYRLLPGAIVNGFALVLPWIELLVGVLLVLGAWRREAALVAVVLLVVFLGAIGWNLARGHAIDCGCFDVRSAGKTPGELLTDMKRVMLRDVGLLLLAGQVLLATSPRFSARRMRV
jgi:uncharacterized membrane protein YphA (DoxX/SURF4 family)